MQQGLTIALLVSLLASLGILGSSRLRNCIRLIGVQGFAVGLLPVLAVPFTHSTLGLIYGVASVASRGILFPWLLLRAQRQSNVRREVEPYVGYGASLMFGAAALVFSSWLSSRLPLPEEPPSAFAMPVTLFLGLTGLFLIISRKKAISQVLGYLSLENAVFAFGVLFVRHQPLVVEFGVMLDIFAAVFVMGIAIFHISREFDHIDADRLASLKD
jgi:hydrogenase-4 component E